MKMEIELLVRLVIPDTTAITAFHTLKRIGFSGLARLKREDYFKFRANNQDFREISSKLGNTDILVNANKNRFEAVKDSEKPPLSESDVRVLVQDRDNKDSGMLSVLRNRLGLKELEDMEKGVLWTFTLDKPDDKEKLAREMTERLLANKHYQEYRIW